MTIELNKEFYEQYINRFADTTMISDEDEFNSAVKSLIKEIYIAGFNDGQKHVNDMRYGNTQEPVEAGEITYIQTEESNV